MIWKCWISPTFLNYGTLLWTFMCCSSRNSGLVYSLIRVFNLKIMWEFETWTDQKIKNYYPTLRECFIKLGTRFNIMWCQQQNLVKPSKTFIRVKTEEKYISQPLRVMDCWNSQCRHSLARLEINIRLRSVIWLDGFCHSKYGVTHRCQSDGRKYFHLHLFIYQNVCLSVCQTNCLSNCLLIKLSACRMCSCKSLCVINL